VFAWWEQAKGGCRGSGASSVIIRASCLSFLPAVCYASLTALTHWGLGACQTEFNKINWGCLCWLPSFAFLVRCGRSEGES